jgi:ubiquinone/menaquinone biosynthesis C-methylase UbiE
VDGYEDWYQTEGRRANHLEKKLLKRLLGKFQKARSLLEIGCGTGHFTRWFTSQGFWTVGLDLSAPMLSEAARLGTRNCMRSDALRLPFPTGAFDLVALITTLEFLPAPHQALVEARRVARDGLILGVINRESQIGRQYTRQGGPVWGTAHLYTPAELTQLAQHAIRGIGEIAWWTTLWPLLPVAMPLPWGGFIGMAVKVRICPTPLGSA